MSSAERAREYRAQKKAGTYVPAPRAPHLPWPRTADDGTELGVDLSVSGDEVRKIVRTYFRAPVGHDMDDYCQEVCARIAARNHMPSAHDPRKSSFTHYVYMVASATGANMSNSGPKELLATGAPGATGPTVESSFHQDTLASEAAMDIERLALHGVIGPTARSYALDCLSGRPTTAYGPARAREALMTEIEDAVGRT